MKKLLFLCLLPTFAVADIINLTYEPPTARVDGTALPPAEIANYRLTWTVKGVVQPDRLIPGGTSTAYTLDTGALTGRTCVILRTVDTDGLESDPSNQSCRNAKPNTPGNLRVR